MPLLDGFSRYNQIRINPRDHLGLILQPVGVPLLTMTCLLGLLMQEIPFNLPCVLLLVT